jgi:hypothetical protein
MHARNPEPISEADGKKLRGFTVKAMLARKACRPQLTSTLKITATYLQKISTFKITDTFNK